MKTKKIFNLFLSVIGVGIFLFATYFGYRYIVHQKANRFSLDMENAIVKDLNHLYSGYYDRDKNWISSCSRSEKNEYLNKLGAGAFKCVRVSENEQIISWKSGKKIGVIVGEDHFYYSPNWNDYYIEGNAAKTTTNLP